VCSNSLRYVNPSLTHHRQADGLQSRTFEVSPHIVSDGFRTIAESTQIFDSLGFGQDVWREANHMLEIRFWVSPFPPAILGSSLTLTRTPVKTANCIDPT
jgi:hypothetical protein